MRKITVSVLLDHKPVSIFRKWLVKRKIRKDIAYASSKFSKEFLIQFSIIEFVDWGACIDSEVLDRDNAMRQIIAKRSGCSGDIILAFTDKSIFNVKNLQVCVGAAASNGGCVVIKLRRHSRFVLIHELGHLFGAEHTDEISVMDKYDPGTPDFDEENKQIIFSNRNRKF
ncbi:MAG: hypothetical protein HYT12_02485 [Candidatus Liptonbacteria bacterium]|nr:hypothetical protein [Candidatus Liptonbacteria bacterium]